MLDIAMAAETRHPTVTPLGPPHRSTRFGGLHNYFLTGLIVAGPVAITIYLTWTFVQWVDSWVKPFIPERYLPETYLPFQIPGFGLVVAVVGLTLIGFFTANLVGRSLVRFGENLLDRMPVVRGIYKALKQVFSTVFSQSIVFISSEPSPVIEEKLPGGEREAWVSVFMPCAPNPTTGFFFLLPKSKVIELSISIEQATKLVISAGLIQPESIAQATAEIEP
jgi:uncharacterized membrane protein